MKKDQIIVVAGMPRSGTSLTMQMLHAAGIPLYYDHPASFEVDRMHDLPADSSWMDECKGKAVKILDIHLNTPPSHYDYKFIITRRNEKEQARSMLKLVNLMDGATASRREVRQMATSIEHDLKLVRKTCQRLTSPENIIEIWFEGLLLDTSESCKKIAQFIETDKIEPMVDCVIDRSPECLSGMLESQLIDKYENL